MADYRINNFDVMKRMALENKRIMIAPLTNVIQAQKVKAGTKITIGVMGDQVRAIACDEYVGGLILADSKQFEETKAQMAKEMEASK
jgi:hypothetical protein